MELEKILPDNGPAINEVKKYISKYTDELIVIKCGGSVLLDKNLFNQFIEDISIINKLGLNSIVVHGGGKKIKQKLDEQNIESKFIDGLRITDSKVIKIVEETFDLSPFHIEQRLKLRNPIYFETASYGHMGRNPQIVKKSFVSKSGEVKEIEVELFTWEKLDYVEILKNKFNIL